MGVRAGESALTSTVERVVRNPVIDASAATPSMTLLRAGHAHRLAPILSCVE
jgi:hypothetical protein